MFLSIFISILKFYKVPVYKFIKNERLLMLSYHYITVLSKLKMSILYIESDQLFLEGQTWTKTNQQFL